MKATGLIRSGLLLLLVSGSASLAFGSAAFALSVDFTDGSWDAAHGTTSYTVHPSGVDLSATGGLITVNYVGGPSGDDSGNDGLGIGDDEITQGGREQLTVAFASAVTLERVYITDLFQNEGGTGLHERGEYSLNGGAFTSFVSVGGVNGALTLNIFQPGVTTIAFRSVTDSWSDFSVKKLTYATPEPSPLLFLGASLILFWTLFRRQRVSSH